jgi:hypothetical protein
MYLLFEFISYFNFIIEKNLPEGSRRRQRPRLRWLEDVEKGVWEIKFKRWRLKAVDREELASLIKEAKTVRGPYSQGVSK